MHHNIPSTQMNIVIPLKDTPSTYPELTYCLRSIDKYYPTDVYIVSKQKIKGTNHIYYEDKTLNRYENVRQKVLKACDVLKEPFIFMNDDMYLLEPFKEVDYYCGKLKERTRTGSVQRAIVNGAIKESKDGLNYSIHQPMVIDPEIMRGIKSLSFKDIHGSISTRKKVKLKDVKMRSKKDHAHPEKFIDGLPFFSTSDFSLKIIGDFMESLYP